MVEADHIEQRHVALHAPDPPRVVFRLVRCPVVHGVAPQLTGCRIVIGRYACHQLGAAVGLQLEQLGVCPYIGRVGGNVNRDVTDDLNALFVGILAQCRPLLEENILQKNTEIYLVTQLCGHFFECCRLAVAHILVRPHVDRHVMVFLLLERHEQRVIRQPFAVLLGEGGDFLAHFRCHAAVCLAEQRPAGIGQLLEIRGIRRSIKIALTNLIRSEQTVLHEQIHVNQIRIACRCRKALVRRIAEAGMTERKHLPVGLVRCRQKIYKITGGLAHGAHAVRRRQ